MRVLLLRCDAQFEYRNVFKRDPAINLVMEVDNPMEALTAGQWLLLPSTWFEYMDHFSMPI